MNFVKAINSLGSQAWAAFLILAGFCAFALAIYCHQVSVQTSITGAAGTIIGAAVMLFRGQAHPADTGDDAPPTNPAQ
jgi:hypothetical protein